MENKTQNQIDPTVRQSRPIELKDLGIDKANVPKASYTILLINSTDHIIRMVRINGGKWAPTPLVGRTCNSKDFDTCFNAQKYAPICTVGCGESVKVDVAWQNADGSWTGAGWNAFTADCNYYGGVVMLVNG